MPVKITPAVARALHANFLMNAASNPATLTQAVIFDFMELNDAIKSFKQFEKAQFVDNINFGFAAYYGRYLASEPGDKANRNTLIVQFLEKIDGHWHAIQGEIYNFGDLKPPKVIFDEQVVP